MGIHNFLWYFKLVVQW